MPSDTEIIEAAILAHHTLSVRSENHGAYDSLFVDHHQLRLLDTPDWQLIYGRRGAGKTILLHVFQRQLLAAPRTSRVLPIYINAQDAVISPPVGRQIDDYRRAHGYFQTFMERLGDELVAAASAISRKPGFWASVTGNKNASGKNIGAIVREVVDLVQGGRPVMAYSDETYERAHETTVDSSTDIGAQISAGRQVRGSGHLGAAKKQATSTRETTSLQGRPVPRYVSVRNAMIELTKLLDVDRINVLIDDWYVLDPTAATGIQPALAELLKRAFAGTPQISIKIASSRFHTSLSDRESGAEYRGLEIGADIFEGVNLDRAVLSESELIQFCETMLFKRLLLNESRLRTYVTAGSAEPSPRFIDAIFENRGAFAELVRGAEGIPRDFLILFRGLAQRYSWSVEPRWTIDAVREVVLDHTASTAADIKYESDAGRLLTLCIKELVTHNGSRWFFLRKEQNDRLRPAIDDLLEKHLIHEWPVKDAPASVRERLVPYRLGYGLWQDWERAVERVSGGEVEDPQAPTISDDIIAEKHTVDASPLLSPPDPPAQEGEAGA